MRDPKRTNEVGGGRDRKSVWYCARYKNKNIKGDAELLEIKDYWRKSESVGPSEVLRDTGIPLSWINTGVLDAGIAARLDITDHRLIVVSAIGSVCVDVAVVRVLAVVASGGVDGGHVTFL